MGVYSWLYWQTLPAEGRARFFLGPLNHTQIRVGAWLCPSQLSGSERDSQTLERVCSTSTPELLMHASTGPSRNVPGYACPFTERLQRIQKRARPQPAF